MKEFDVSTPMAYPMEEIHKNLKYHKFFAVCMCPLPMGILMDGMHYSFMHKVIPNIVYTCTECGQGIRVLADNIDDYPEHIKGFTKEEFFKKHEEYLERKRDNSKGA